MSIEYPTILQKDVSLKNLNTWRVGGQAEYFCRPSSLSEIQQVYHWACTANVPTTLLGGGSNVLISDQGINGLVICTKDFDKIEKSYEHAGKYFIKAQAGAKKAEVLKLFLKKDLAPALFLAGLPGDVAGGVVMNAGVAEAIVPREFNEIVYEFEVLRCHDGQLNILNFRNDEVFWEYRHSKGWQPGIILTVTMAWPMQPDKDLKTKVRAANQMRLQKQPLKEPSCGSTFRNPPGNSAGRLIEQAGLKGFKVGGAEVSRKHANFIVTSEGATAKDVNAVMDHIVKTVEDKFSISLQSEVVKLGQW